MSRKDNLFNQVPIQKVNRSMFDLSHEVNMTGEFGKLHPCLCMEVMPGDSITDQMTAMVRLAPMLAPPFHRIDVTTHFFFVPYRLLSDHWETFITGGRTGLSEVVLPYVTPAAIFAESSSEGTMDEGSLWNNLGLPPVLEDPTLWSNQVISVLPFRAYAKIWSDYYRDPNLQDELDLDLELQGDVTVQSIAAGLLVQRDRGWQKDYFTAALPWAQRGAEVLLPLAGTVDVTYLPISSIIRSDTNVPLETDSFLGTDDNVGAPGLRGNKLAAGDLGIGSRVENIDNLEMDATTTINDFRRALAIQRWLENNARGGGRYIEQLEAHFNVRVPDFRLQRAEYLGGGKQPVQMSEVVATAQTEGAIDTPLGDMAGHGLSVGKTNRFSYRCPEHGVIIGIINVQPVSKYWQGIPKMWTKTNKFEFGWPELAHLGEQEILSKEVFFSFDFADTAENEQLFGYIPRYSEYKFMQDRVAGDFLTTLGFWTLVRNFTERPVLDAFFTTMSNDNGKEQSFDRIFAVQDGTPYLWFQLFHRISAMRPLPYFGVPKII